MTAKPVVSHWRGHVPLESDGALRLKVSGSSKSIRNAGLWLASDAASLADLDGRILLGSSSMRAGVRLELASFAAVDEKARTLDLGRVALKSPERLGTVSLVGHWTDPVHVLVSAPTQLGGVWGWKQSTRRFDLAQSRRSLVVSAYFVDHEFVSTVWSASAWSDKNLKRVTEEASIGASIGLESPTRRGLDLSVDVVALPRASRVVVPGAGSAHGATLGKDEYRALLDGARWTAVVPQSIARAGKPRYEVGYVPFPDGPARIEVWSVRNENGRRTLLFQTAVDVQGDVVPVLLR